jgi:Ankyrin repeats (3 copies)
VNSLEARGPGSGPLHQDISVFISYVHMGQISLVGSMISTMKQANRLDDLLGQIEPRTGMTALHIAVGRNNLEMVKMLVEAGAKFQADFLGRWPSTIAAECEASEELCDFIVEAEENALLAE